MEESIRKKIGLKIREIRKKRNLTQECLSEKIGVTGKFIGAVERGESFASFQTLEDIAKALDCDLRYFFAIDYLDSTSAELNALLKKRLKQLSHDQKRQLMQLIDAMTQ